MNRRAGSDHDERATAALRAWLDRPLRFTPAEARRQVEQTISARASIHRRSRRWSAGPRSPLRWAVALALAGALAGGYSASLRFARRAPPPMAPGPLIEAQSVVIVELPSGTILFVPLDQETP